MKEISTGGLSFAEIREEGMYYVDKSLLIKNILDVDRRGVHLFTRPRRFGKSTNLSMLDAFFNMNYKGNTWFDDLEISKYPEYEKYKNAFPVIYLDLKNTEVDDYDTFITRIRSSLSLLFNSFGYLLKMDDMPEADIELFQRVSKLSVDAGRIEDSIPLLCRLLERYHGVKPIILIDEYDRAVSDAFGSESHEPMMKLLGRILGAALKGNKHLQMAVVTGVMQIAKESIFSGLNNLEVNNVFSVESDERYGFTEREVKQIISDYGGGDDEFKEAKQWYDGYRFGNSDVYNPLSIMTYVRRKFVPESYWAGTSYNTIIDDMLEGMDADMYSKFVALSKGGTISTEVVQGVPYSDLMIRNSSIISLMVMSGYLTGRKNPDKRSYEISIPNKEMLYVFESKFIGRIGTTGDRIRELSNAITSGKKKQLHDSLESLIMSIDSKVLSHEHSYQAFCLGLLMNLEGPYEITNEGKAGKGYYDIRLRSTKRNLPHIIIELKRKKKGDPSLEKLAQSALDQIRDNQYTRMLKGETILYGIAFDKSDVETVTETLTLRHPIGNLNVKCSI